MVLAAVCSFPPDGEKSLEVLRLAQQANAGRYPHGELQATLRWGQYGKLEYHSRAETRLVWSDDRLWADALNSGRHNHEFTFEPGKSNHEYWIVERQRVLCFEPGAKRVFIASPTSLQPGPHVLVSPSAWWYGRICWVGPSWREVLDPQNWWANDAKGTDAEYPAYSVTSKSNDLIEVVVKYARYKAERRLRFSLASDGNPVEYTYAEPAPERTVKGACEWARDSQGRLYLARRKHEETYANGDFRVYHEYAVNSFNPDYAPDAQQFTIASLKLPAGTVVRDEISRKTRRIGDRPVQAVVESLDPLIELMRSRGFASSDKR
jgi:hypothetical protein